MQEINKNKRVSFYFEHDNQVQENWKSVLLIGDAEPVSVGSSDYNKAIERLGECARHVILTRAPRADEEIGMRQPAPRQAVLQLLRDGAVIRQIVKGHAGATPKFSVRRSPDSGCHPQF